MAASSSSRFGGSGHHALAKATRGPFRRRELVNAGPVFARQPHETQQLLRPFPCGWPARTPRTFSPYRILWPPVMCRGTGRNITGRSVVNDFEVVGRHSVAPRPAIFSVSTTSASRSRQKKKKKDDAHQEVVLPTRWGPGLSWTARAGRVTATHVPRAVTLAVAQSPRVGTSRRDVCPSCLRPARQRQNEKYLRPTLPIAMRVLRPRQRDMRAARGPSRPRYIRRRVPCDRPPPRPDRRCYAAARSATSRNPKLAAVATPHQIAVRYPITAARRRTQIAAASSRPALSKAAGDHQHAPQRQNGETSHINAT